jgi:hypothetical protein
MRRKVMAAGGGPFQSKSKEICAEEKQWVADAENDCVPSSTQTGSHRTLQIYHD